MDTDNDILTRLGQTVVNAVETLVDVARSTWNVSRDRVREIWGSLFDVGTDVDNPDELEQARRESVSNALREVLGDSPLQALCETSTEERRKVLSDLTKHIAEALQIPIPSFRVKIIKQGVAGFYEFGADRVVVSRAEVDRFPLDIEDAAELLDTVLHELYHAFQHHAISDPSSHGITREQAKIWRRNFDNYISPEQNARLYHEQPVEVTARLFAHEVVCAFRGK